MSLAQISMLGIDLTYNVSPCLCQTLPASIAICDKVFKKVFRLEPASLLKKRLRHRCFPVSFAKF